VWDDPDFRSESRAFYYARHACKSQRRGGPPLRPAKLRVVPPEVALPLTVQDFAPVLGRSGTAERGGAQGRQTGSTVAALKKKARRARCAR